jgi:hypothetical protein
MRSYFWSTALAFCLILLGSGRPVLAQNGDGVIFPYLPSGGPSNAVGIRYDFKVVQNTCTTDGKIQFSDSRYWGPDADTYLIEHNLYSSAQIFTDPVYTTWPLEGTTVTAQASLRLAAADYNKKGLVGVETEDPAEFPRQQYLIDGFGVPKTDMISQFNLNAKSGSVEVVRGPIITNLTGWKYGSVPLPSNVQFREWDATATIEGKAYKTKFALPDRNAQYLAPWELLVFSTEFFKYPGQFKIYVWNMAYLLPSATQWQAINQWQVTSYDGDGSDFGFKKIAHAGAKAIEISSSDGPYTPLGGVIDLSTP